MLHSTLVAKTGFKCFLDLKMKQKNLKQFRKNKSVFLVSPLLSHKQQKTFLKNKKQNKN